MSDTLEDEAPQLPDLLQLDKDEIGTKAPLPTFPAIAWRGMFEEYYALMADDPAEPGTPVSECPMPFHFASFLSVAAAELGDRVRIAEGKKSFPNFFIFICGRTGTKKSTAGDLVEEHIVGNYPDVSQAAMLTSISSGEGLIRTLMQRPNVLLRYDEVKDLFVTAGRTGSRIEPLLNSAFDLRPLAAIVKRSKDSLSVREYFLNLIICGTPTHVLVDLSESFFKGGLLNRFLVFAANPTGIVKPTLGMPDQPAAAALSRKLFDKCLAWRTFAPLRGQIRMRMSPEAKALHDAWYLSHTKVMKDLSDIEADPLTRLDVYSKRVAMVYALLESEPCDAPEITAAQMEASLAVVRYSQACMTWMTEAWTGQRTVQQQSEALVQQRVEAYLRRNGCVRERDLYRALHIGITECAKTVNALVAVGVAGVSSGTSRLVHILEACTCDQ